MKTKIKFLGQFFFTATILCLPIQVYAGTSDCEQSSAAVPKEISDLTNSQNNQSPTDGNELLNRWEVLYTGPSNVSEGKLAKIGGFKVVKVRGGCIYHKPCSDCMGGSPYINQAIDCDTLVLNDVSVFDSRGNLKKVGNIILDSGDSYRPSQAADKKVRFHQTQYNVSKLSDRNGLESFAKTVIGCVNKTNVKNCPEISKLAFESGSINSAQRTSSTLYTYKTIKRKPYAVSEITAAGQSDDMVVNRGALSVRTGGDHGSVEAVGMGLAGGGSHFTHQAGKWWEAYWNSLGDLE